MDSVEGLDTSLDKANGGSSFLARYFDAALELPADLSAEVITGDQIGRLVSDLAIAIYATSLPRRLGGDASSEDLALDKKRGRRTAHALSQSLRAWAGKVPDLKLDDELRRRGAQLDWMRFKGEHAVQVNAEMRAVATWALRTDNHEFGKHALVKLGNELGWVDYALRD